MFNLDRRIGKERSMRLLFNIRSGRILILLITFFYSSWSYSSSNTRVEQIRDEILSLAVSDDIKASYALLDTLHKLDKHDLSNEELIKLYMELLDYYIGEGPGEILSEKITSMGEKILPYLVEKKNTHVKCLEKYRKICITTEERNLSYLIDAIKNGKILYAEYPESLRGEIIKNVSAVRIFIEDYKRVKGILPNDLDVLRKYVWNMYGYKLQIWNPWAEDGKVQYKPQKGGKYILDAGFEN